MLTLKQFTDKWLGKLIDYDGAFGGQCFDVVNQYIADIYGKKPIISLAKASDILKKPSGVIPGGIDYEVIMNGPDNAPQTGDWIVWDDANWNYNCGHVAVCLEADTNSATIFQQNGGKQDEGARIIKWDFHKFAPAGWIHFKDQNNQDQIMYNETKAEAEKMWNGDLAPDQAQDYINKTWALRIEELKQQEEAEINALMAASPEEQPKAIDTALNSKFYAIRVIALRLQELSTK
jgi:hypothetical protein